MAGRVGARKSFRIRMIYHHRRLAVRSEEPSCEIGFWVGLLRRGRLRAA